MCKAHENGVLCVQKQGLYLMKNMCGAREKWGIVKAVKRLVIKKISVCMFLMREARCVTSVMEK